MEPFLIQLLTVVGYQLPELLACGAALALLWMWAQPAAPGRTLALWGTGLLLGSAVLRLLASVFQAWNIHHMPEGGYESMQGLFMVISALTMLFGLVSSAGLVLLAWGAAKAMRAPR